MTSFWLWAWKTHRVVILYICTLVAVVVCYKVTGTPIAWWVLASDTLILVTWCFTALYERHRREQLEQQLRDYIKSQEVRSFKDS